MHLLACLFPPTLKLSVKVEVHSFSCTCSFCMLPARTCCTQWLIFHWPIHNLSLTFRHREEDYELWGIYSLLYLLTFPSTRSSTANSSTAGKVSSSVMHLQPFNKPVPVTRLFYICGLHCRIVFQSHSVRIQVLLEPLLYNCVQSWLTATGLKIFFPEIFNYSWKWLRVKCLQG